MEDVHGIWTASDHPSRTWFMSFRADHIPQTHQWLIAPRRSFSFMELFPAQGETGEVYERYSDSIQREGENLQAVWSLDAKLIAVLSRGRPAAEGSGVAQENVLPQTLPSLRDPLDHATSTRFCGAFGLRFHPHDGNEATKSSRSLDNGLDSEGVQAAFMQSLFSPNVCCYPARVLPATEVVVCDILRWTTGIMFNSIYKKGLGSGDASCASVASEQQILAVGTRRGVVELPPSAYIATTGKEVAAAEGLEHAGLAAALAADHRHVRQLNLRKLAATADGRVISWNRESHILFWGDEFTAEFFFSTLPPVSSSCLRPGRPLTVLPPCCFLDHQASCLLPAPPLQHMAALQIGTSRWPSASAPCFPPLAHLSLLAHPYTCVGAEPVGRLHAAPHLSYSAAGSTNL
ncbi:hypothetical protein HYC85_016450 [Camellia sinensis]|uniref:Uncharacterized protein n=1 Tax=Camellia sinensis TaxID=4442 RepID=A0A7J7GZP6_CAMSI|nr:hypothetical protein HYC85_016450 [Camellia sinensis]